MKKIGKIIIIVLIILLILMCIVGLIIYSLPLTKNYTTKLGYVVEVPFFSQVEDKMDHIKDNGTNEIIFIKSYQEYNSDDMEKMLAKGLKKYETENEVYYYNEKENYTISINERKNLRCQMQFMPKKYWRDLVEFN